MTDHAHVRYRVKHTRVAHEPNERGGFHKVFTTHYETPGGTPSFVETPEHLYTAHNVHNQIMDEMQHIEAVEGLQEGMPAPQPPPQTQ